MAGIVCLCVRSVGVACVAKQRTRECLQLGADAAQQRHRGVRQGRGVEGEALDQIGRFLAGNQCRDDLREARVDSRGEGAHTAHHTPRQSLNSQYLCAKAVCRVHVRVCVC